MLALGLGHRVLRLVLVHFPMKRLFQVDLVVMRQQQNGVEHVAELLSQLFLVSL